ncbi:ATP-binding protein [Streptomyces sp. HUAS TT20]|uniref:ATP-binding protein n=1 Tax=Streptomyces sp. HUAS TT20 TaxID=3447509 RepID=UPI0021D9661B|nr:ATP-binding protein [Streptomyces sp. HUAS 15-9]UXY27286.1 ATP-binding protein [Streptomyces sp. HUAS 15-9]
MNYHLPHYRMSLTASDHSVRHIRRIVRSLLDDWELTHLTDALELGVSELVTNVVRHVPDRRCSIAVLRLASSVRVEVTDGSAQVPLPLLGLVLDQEAEGGRGLALLDAVVDKWGVSPGVLGGKTVWFECGESPQATRRSPSGVRW